MLRIDFTLRLDEHYLSINNKIENETWIKISDREKKQPLPVTLVIQLLVNIYLMRYNKQRGDAVHSFNFLMFMIDK